MSDNSSVSQIISDVDRSSTSMDIPTLEGTKIHYFDYAATTFMPECVMDKWHEFHCNAGVFIGRGSSILAQKAEKELIDAEAYFHEFFGLSEEYGFIYSKNVTESINILALSLVKQISKLDIILIGPYEHHSNYLPWKYLAQQTGALFCEIPTDVNGNPDYSYIERNRERIKILSLSCISNSFGYCIEINRVCSLIGEKTLLFVDQSQVTAHRRIISDEKISAHFISSHKMYGPKNIALTAVKKELLARIDPVLLGGGMVETVGFKDTWLGDRKKFLAGTMDIGLIGAWAEACRFISNISFTAIQKSDSYYSQKIKGILNKYGFDYIAIGDSCVDYIISFTHRSLHAHDISDYLSENNVIIRSGNLCSQNALRKININAINRISLGHGLTDNDVKQLDKVLGEMTLSMNEQYSEKIKQYASMNSATLVIPDLIMVKEGVACGDHIIVSGEVDDGVLLFGFSASNACALCKAVCNYLNHKFNNMRMDEVLEQVKELHDKISSDNEYIYQLFDIDIRKYHHRFDCLFAPIRLLFSFLNEISVISYKYDEKPNTLSTMECDACVGACRINWNNKEKVTISHHGDRAYPTSYLKDWLPLGKIVLNNSEKQLLKRKCSEMDAGDHQFLSDYTMNSFVLHHLLNNFPELIDEKWKAAGYLIQKNEITRGYIEKVKQYIISNGLDIYFVKGYVSQKYYENPSLRIHSDYDLVSTNSEDAFQLSNYLLRNGFRIRPNLFSFKKINQNGKEVISGHFHLEKIIDDTYMLELDISFPGFLINRVDLYCPKYANNEISLEDQIVITLLHLFKHSNIYMKDINDIYYMLKEDALDLKYLSDIISHYHLNEFFSLAVMYIYHNYDADMAHLDRLIEYFKTRRNIFDDYPNWPYDKASHIMVKQKDYNERLLTNPESDRNYLYPVVIFCDGFDFSLLERGTAGNFKITKILNTLYEVSHESYVFYLTSIGIFINNYIDTAVISRKGFIEVLSSLLDIINIKEYFPIPYSTDHFYVRVI